MEEVLKALNIVAKALAHRSNVLWDILLGTEKAAKALAGKLLSYKKHFIYKQNTWEPGRPELLCTPCLCISQRTIWGPIF